VHVVGFTVLRYFVTSGATRPTTRRHVTDDLIYLKVLVHNEIKHQIILEKETPRDIPNSTHIYENIILFFITNFRVTNIVS
jgi:hypothetical protein